MAVRRTQQQRRDDAREALLNAATELLGTNGYAATTLGEIGRRAGASRGLVTYHFGNKLNCIRAVVERIRETVSADMLGGDGGLRGLDGLDHAVERYLLRYQDDPAGPAMFITIVEAISATPELEDLILEHTDAFRAIFLGRIDEAKVDGDVPETVDAATSAILIAGLLRGIALQYLVDRSAVELPTVIAGAQRMVRASLQSALLPVEV